MNIQIKSGALQQVLALASLVVLVLFFTFSSSNFFQFSNIVGILLSTAVIGVLALGSTFVIITGGIDLSVGTVMTLSGVMTGVCITFWGLPVPVGILGGILTGALCGLLSGTAVAKMKIPPFIATLAMMMIAKGLALIISGAKPVYFNDAESFAEVSQGSVLGWLVPGLDIPNAVVILFIAAIHGYHVLKNTNLARINI